MGPEFRFFYNDRYRPVLGASKHPGALGAPAQEIFPEAWPFIGPLFESTRQGESVALDDMLIPLDRYGYLENCYFTLSYSPIRDESGGVGGMLAVVAETTERVEGERRLRTLRELAQWPTGARTVEESCKSVAEVLGENPIDAPFSLFYLVDPDGTWARLAAAVGLPGGTVASPTTIDLTSNSDNGWPLAAVAHSRKARVVEDLALRFGALPGGPYPEPTHTAVVTPMRRPGQEHPDGLIVLGISPRRALDERYRTFIELAADQTLTAIRNARAYEDERKRAEALAEIDQAKTAFFSNVSHEFRTPLTLMLGPLEDMLAQTNGLPAADRERLEVAHRNSLRLLKLVNTLLDFSRIEAGRIQASYEPSDLAVYTAELASVFRSAIERAGLRLVVNCPPLSPPVYVDGEMWEKIVLNLISNAFKFTFAGDIEVSLQQAGEMVELVVSDTGTGIPAAELPRIFERFHRVKGARGRSYEGSGIGLALVQELVKLHGGVVRVESEVDCGTTFTVSIPLGKAHLPADRIGAARTIASTGLRGKVYVEETLRWLSEDGGETIPTERTEVEAKISPHRPEASSPCPRILLADDNADMRNYIRRLLSQAYEVIAVNDGAAALRAVREHRPDLVLADVMMPFLDGFGLLRELRADERLKAIPVILLSARAGEESRIEGLKAGAADYLVKPFSARELQARIGAHLALARMRREVEAEKEKSFALLENIADAFYALDAEFRFAYINRRAEEYFSLCRENIIGRNLWEVLPAGIGTAFQEQFERALREHIPVAFEIEAPVSKRWVDVRAYPAANWLLINFRDITERKHQESNRAFLTEISQTLAQLTSVEETMQVLGAKIGAHLNLSLCAFIEINEAADEAIVTHDWHRGDVPGVVGTYRLAEYLTDDFQRAVRAGEVFIVRDAHADPRTDGESYLAHKVAAFVCVPLVREGQWRFMLAIYDSTARDWHPEEIELVCELTTHIWTRLERARAEQTLRESEERFRLTAKATGVTLFQQDANLRYAWLRSPLTGYTVEEVVGRTDEEIEPVIENTAALIRAKRGVLATKQGTRIEVIKRLPDGSREFNELMLEPRLDATGQAIGLLGASVNINARKIYEASLRESEEKYRTLFESIDQGFCTIEVLFDENERPLDYRFLVVNPAFERQTGIENAVGKWMRDIAPLHEEYWFEIYGRIALTGESVRFDNHAEQLHRYYDVYAFRVGEPMERKVAILFNDVTNRKQVEEALRKSEERFRMLANNMSQLAWTCDELGFATWYNQRWYEYTGFTWEQMQGDGWKSVHHPEHLDRVIASLQHSLTSGQAWEDTFPLRGKDGNYSWFLSRAIPIPDATGKIVSWFGTNTDVTKQREAEEALRETDRRKDEFLAMLAHELRNPLAPIRNAVQVLKLIGPAEASMERARAVIERQTHHLTRLVEDLLDVSRITQGKVRLTQEPLELQVIINRAVETSRPLIDARRHQLTVVLPPEPVQVEGDLTRLVQIVGNLLNNAAKYTDEGGQIRVEAAAEAGQSVIRVRDNGAGLSADLLPHVFDLFTQADRSLDRSQGGLGIGLTLVRQLVELHGGRVEARSDGPNQGSEFIVRLPTISSVTATSTEESSGTSAGLVRSKLRVLVVEDNADSAEMMAFVLELGGHEVRLAGDGLEALEVARAFRPQVVLCDIGLPKMDGYEVAEQLRLQPEFKQARLIALSGYGQEEDRRRARAAGFDYHLTKPVDPEALEALLDSLQANESAS